MIANVPPARLSQVLFRQRRILLADISAAAALATSLLLALASLLV